MLFMTYFELSQDVPLTAGLAGAQKIMAAGLFPAPDVTIIRWDISPDSWGVLLAEAESVAAIEGAINVWRAAIPGFFRVTRTAPAAPVQENIGRTAELLQRLGGA